MSKLIVVPVGWSVYKVPDEVLTLFGQGMGQLPPQMVLEGLVMQGLAKRVATTMPFSFKKDSSDDDEEWTSSEDGPEELSDDDSEEEPETPEVSDLWYKPQNEG